MGARLAPHPQMFLVQIAALCGNAFLKGKHRAHSTALIERKLRAAFSRRQVARAF